MGQARRRGSFEERAQLAIERQRIADEARQIEEQAELERRRAEWAALSPEEKTARLQVAAMLAMANGPIVRGGDRGFRWPDGCEPA
jgi:hypothetical protein